MQINTSTPHSTPSQILAHLRTLRANLAHARDALMHFKDDRLDRDKLEPAARRVDDLMNMYASTSRNEARILFWMGEIRSGVERVNNPKAAEALHEARIDIAALFEAMGMKQIAAAVPNAENGEPDPGTS